MSNIRLINDKRSILDLSAVKDAEGKMIILQPKGTKGSSRECHEEVLDHPHVQDVIKARWAHSEKISLTVPTDEAPPVIEPVRSPSTVDTTATSSAPPLPAPPAEEPHSSEEAPASETAPREPSSSEEAPAPETAPREPSEPSTTEPVVATSETLEMGERPTTSVVSTNDGKNKNKGKGRNDR